MKSTQAHVLFAISALILSACSTGSLLEKLPDRRPDYRQSQLSRQIEVPPDLVGNTLNDQLQVSDFNPVSVASYSSYEHARVKRNQRGFIEVLPTLHRVNVVENSGDLPYLQVDADPETTWQIIKKYWQYNGIRLKVNEPRLGIMETDWLENKSDLPQTGFSALINKALGFLHDSDKRDRYRLRFVRTADNRTEVTLVYSESEQVGNYEMGSKDPSGFSWQLSDNKNPELQLEMTRRIALFIAAELERRDRADANPDTASSAVIAQLSRLNDGQSVLLLNGSYAQSWRVLGIALDKASFAINHDDYQSGTYQVRYQPQADQQSRSFFARLWNRQPDQENRRPEYLVRLSDQSKQSLAVVQNLDGSSAPPDQAQALLETVQSVL